MKKILTRTLVVLVLIMALALSTACSLTDETSSSSEPEQTGGQPTALAVPTVTVNDDGLASWTCEHATSYLYKIGAEGEEKPTTETSKQLTDKQEISVKAVGDGENYTDSDWSDFFAYSRTAVEAKNYRGWYNYSPNSAEFEVTEDDVIINPQGTAFGSQVILNDQLAEEITGPYYMSFDLDATEYDTGSEIWISILGNWTESLGNGFRTGLHFAGNNWLDVASYGFAQGTNYNFINVVSYKDSGDGVGVATAATTKLFPSLDEIVHVVFAMTYDANENIVGNLWLNSVLVQTVDYTALYGAEWTFTDVQAVGFDVYMATRYDIVLSNVRVTNGEYYGGWEVISENASTLTTTEHDVTITPSGTVFGNGFTLNSELLRDIEGEYAIEFDLTATLTNNAESWISIVGAYASYDEDGAHYNRVMRTGLHFFANTWNNMAYYGSLPDKETGFFTVIWPAGTPDAPAEFNFPVLTETLHIKETYTYDENENIIVTTYINGEVVGSYNLTAQYGEEYGINDCTAVGFDVFVGEQGAFTITNFRVSEIKPAE